MNRAMRYRNAIIIILITFIAQVVSASNYIVTTTSDAGAGSLRQAITDANVFPGTHTISFNIPNSDVNYNAAQGVWKITPLSTLPMIMRSNLLIDGTTQTTNQGNTNPDGPEIMIDGNHAFGSDYAFHLYNVTGVIVQGFIIGRFTAGIEISGTNSQNNIIRGNYIGCNYNATDSLSNTQGIEIMSGPHNNVIGGSAASDRNIVSGNNHIGVRVINSNSNVISGNYIGLNRNGNASLRNYDGISIEGTSKYNMIGGYTTGARNFISGNDAYGVVIFGAACGYNTVAGNYAGTDISGSVSVPNTYGVLFDGGTTNNILGGTAAGAGNLLSGNSAYGVFIYNPGTQKNTVKGNLIGTNATGISAVPNANGIVIDGPAYKNIVDSNIISGNSQNGIDIHIGGSDSNVITRNFIGIDITGASPLPNSLDGVRIGEGPRCNVIGSPGKGNVIAFNHGNGVSVMTAAELYNTISANSIFDNGGLGIDLFPEGVTPNDAGDPDSGPNDLLNFPVIDSIFYIAGDAVICGHIDVTSPSATKIELFVADTDISGYGEGKIYLGCTYPMTNGSWRDTISGMTSAGYITATSTDAAGNTSEFAMNFLLPPLEIYEHEGVSILISVKPNPFTETTEISFGSPIGMDNGLKADLYDSEGKLMRAVAVYGNRITINGTGLKAGKYYCKLSANGKILRSVCLIRK